MNDQESPSLILARSRVIFIWSWLMGAFDHHIPQHIEDTSMFLAEGQNPSIILDVYPKIRALLWENERMFKIFHQQGVLFPATMTYTTERIIFHQRTWVGGAYIEDYLWRNLDEGGYAEGPIFAQIEIGKRFEPGAVKLGFLPKVQARIAYGLFIESAIYWHDEHRMRKYEEKRSKGGGVIFKGALATMNTYAVPNPTDPNFIWPAHKTSTPDTRNALPNANRATIPSSNVIQQRPVAAINRDAPRDGRQLYSKNNSSSNVSMNPAERLLKLKNLYEAQLISPEEYQVKRTEIINSIS